jgi:DsbC/DsbD-like thiol-disulfide interchange protein
MKRRSFIFNTFGLALVPEFALAESVWQSNLIPGRFNGKTYEAGWKIEMKPGWKTYWRLPGVGGVPPSIKASGANVKSVTMDFPFPTRLKGEEGDTIGYKDQVIFPVYVEPADLSQPVDVSFQAFFGVCEVVCIPVQQTLKADFDPQSDGTRDHGLLAQWQARVPQRVLEGPVKSVHLVDDKFKAMLVLELVDRVEDIFVEGPPQLYFSAPQFISPQLAHIESRGLKSSAELNRQHLRMTIIQQGFGLEQMVTVT